MAVEMVEQSVAEPVVGVFEDARGIHARNATRSVQHADGADETNSQPSLGPECLFAL